MKEQGDSAGSCKTKKNVLKTPPSSQQNGQSNLTTRTATKQSRWPSSSTSRSLALNTTNICVWELASTSRTVAPNCLYVSTPTSRSDGTIRDIKTKYAESVVNFDEKDPVKWFDNILRQQQVLLHCHTGTTTVDAMEDDVHCIQACTGSSRERFPPLSCTK